MAAPRKYGDELRERATRMAVEARQNPETKAGAIRRISEQLGMHPETLRTGSARPRSTAGSVPAPRPMTSSGWSSSSRRTES